MTAKKGQHQHADTGRHAGGRDASVILQWWAHTLDCGTGLVQRTAPLLQSSPATEELGPGRSDDGLRGETTQAQCKGPRSNDDLNHKLPGQRNDHQLCRLPQHVSSMPKLPIKKIIGERQDRCLYCSGTKIIKKGRRRKKFETIQLWYCKDCDTVFAPRALKGKTYPIPVILARFRGLVSGRSGFRE